MDNIKVEFLNVEDKDVVILNDFCLCTIDYDGDFEIETAKDHIRKIIESGLKGEFEIDRTREYIRKILESGIEESKKRDKLDGYFLKTPCVEKYELKKATNLKKGDNK